MTEPAFTPGPWEWEGKQPYYELPQYGDLYEGLEGSPRADTGTRTVLDLDVAESGDCVHGTHYIRVDAADARLIAAAPDLYEALGACHAEFGRELDGVMLLDPPKWYWLMKAALAKARGEEAIAE